VYKKLTLMNPSENGFLPAHGNYGPLLSFQKAEVIYDITFRFLEGSKASVKSKETEIKLINVARASLEELLDDYRDYLRARDLVLSDKESKEARYVRRLGSKRDQTFDTYREFVETRPAELVANIALCLTHQANYLLNQHLRHLEKEFVHEGGIRERMSRARRDFRDHQSDK